LFFLSVGDNEEQWATVVDPNGEALYHFGYPEQVLSNVAFDNSTQQYFIHTYDSKNQISYLTEWYPSQNGTLTQLVKIPGVVQDYTSTYSQNNHIFFLTLQTSPGNALVQINTQHKQVVSTVAVPDAIEILLWSDIENTMYAWVANESYPGILVTLDITTGQRLKTIVTFEDFSANGGTSVLVESEKKVYASLLDILADENNPVWVVVDLTTGAYTKHYTDPSIGYPINLVQLGDI